MWLAVKRGADNKIGGLLVQDVNDLKHPIQKQLFFGNAFLKKTMQMILAEWWKKLLHHLIVPTVQHRKSIAVPVYP